MKSRFLSFGILMLVLFFFVAGCSKSDDSATADQPPFSFWPTDSSLFAMHGHLVSHIELDSSNYLEVPVRVHQAGPWSFSTGDIDGFQFIGSGNFTDSGLQIITLNGSGIPQSTGLFEFQLQQDGAVFENTVLVEEGYMDFTIDNTHYSLSVFPGSNYSLSSDVSKVQASSQLSFRPSTEYADRDHYFDVPRLNVEYEEFVSPAELGESFQFLAYEPGNKPLGSYFAGLPGFMFGFYYPELQFLLTGSVDQGSDSYLTVVQRQQFTKRYRTSSAGDSTDIPTFKMKVKFDLKVGRGITEAGRLVGDGILQFRLARDY